MPARAATGVIQEIAAVSPELADRIRPDESLLEPVTTTTRPLPTAPTDALIASISALSADLGFPQEANLAVLSAGLPPELTGRLANVLTDMRECNGITTSHFAAIPQDRLDEVIQSGDGLDPANFTDIRSCARNLSVSVGELRLELQDAMRPADLAGCQAATGSGVDLWPVLRFEPDCANDTNGTGDTYSNDYLLTIDTAGNDTYRNNAGSNLVDLNFSPEESAVRGRRGVGPAKGCDRAIPGLEDRDCVPAVAVLLDMAGNDTYGIKETPTHDKGCTKDLLIRRMSTGGVGFLGVGILQDVEGDDTYTGKTVSLGAGHVFGVGVLHDGEGNDIYSSVRNSQGFALVGGLGLLRDSNGRDSNGDDAYDFYMPAPLNSAADNQEEGAGGVRDDEGDGLCDRIPRFVQGAGNVTGGIGLLIDDAGNDRYVGAFSDEFIAPQAFDRPTDFGGSQGFGNNTGLGIMLDRGTGTDSYTAKTIKNKLLKLIGTDRADDTLLFDPASPKSTTSAGGGQGLFKDGDD